MNFLSIIYLIVQPLHSFLRGGQMKARTCVLLLALIILSATSSAQTDVEGSEDHPIITRYPGSVIEWYDVQEFDRYKIAIGPVTGYRHIDDWHPVEGKVTRIFYTLSGSRSSNEVYLNYSKALEKNGFEILADRMFGSSNVKGEIGARGWLGVYFAENTVPPGVPLLTGSSTSGGSAFVAGKLTKNNATVYVAVSVAQYSDEIVYYLIDIVKEQPVENEFIFVNADVMLDELKENGKIALYGIYFDFDKDDVKTESETTLTEIANLLKNNPQLKLYVVGHTDMKGKLDYNVNLSKRRAAAVVKELTTNYGIKSDMLTPDGVGALAPVATNETEVGRKNNRRVELVAK
jgi:outer membrane protein OmpA-like peptidoglycan-associated protein